MDTDQDRAQLLICQVCGTNDAKLASDPHGCEPDLLCDPCRGAGLRREEWWA